MTDCLCDCHDRPEPASRSFTTLATGMLDRMPTPSRADWRPGLPLVSILGGESELGPGPTARNRPIPVPTPPAGVPAGVISTEGATRPGSSSGGSMAATSASPMAPLVVSFGWQDGTFSFWVFDFERGG